MRRIQRQRTKGWRMPPDAMYVGRPTKWGNPYRPGWTLSARGAVDAYGPWLHRHPYLSGHLFELRGKDLVCWCPLVDVHGNPVPCHADVLLELANRDTSDRLLDSGRADV